MTLAGSTLAVGEFKNPASRPAAVDPIDAEVIMHGLCAIPNLIDKNVTRTAFSFLISEYKDYATGIVDGEGRLISQCRGGLPIFCANALCAAVRDGLKVYGKAGMQHGDVVISNDAATMGQHLNNVVMYTPIRVSETDDGLIGFMVIVMHWVDVGGITIGSCQSPNTTDVFQEGIQFPTVKLLSGGERVAEIYRLIERNTRFPRLVLGDVESQVAGCLMGRDQVLDLAKRYGEDAIRSAIEMFWTKSELATRKAIAEIPDGEYRASAFLDDDGIHPGVPIKINVVVRIEGSDIIIDLSDIADQVQGPLNAGYEGGAVAAARIACKYIFSANEPANDGAFRPIKVICPDWQVSRGAAYGAHRRIRLYHPHGCRHDPTGARRGRAATSPGGASWDLWHSRGRRQAAGRRRLFPEHRILGGRLGRGRASRRHRTVSVKRPWRHQGSTDRAAGSILPVYLRMGATAPGFRRRGKIPRRPRHRKVLPRAGAVPAHDQHGTHQMRALGPGRRPRGQGRTHRGSPRWSLASNPDQGGNEAATRRLRARLHGGGRRIWRSETARAPARAERCLERLHLFGCRCGGLRRRRR